MARGSVTGKVKWYDPNKGYGFIKRDDGQKDVFFHAKELEASQFPGFPNSYPQEGEALLFDTSVGKKGDFAINISPA